MSNFKVYWKVIWEKNKAENGYWEYVGGYNCKREAEEKSY